MAEIVIAIPTFRRPKGLARLLASLAALKTTADVAVIVGDNDAEGRAGEGLCRARREAGYRWPLEALVVPARGIAQNRNALVAAALAQPDMRYLAMLDDDEWVEPGWLDALLQARGRFEADAVEGPVVGMDEEGGRVADYGGVAGHRGGTAAVDMIVGAGNILLTRPILERLGAPHFDPQFALSGGEDRDFFLRLKQAGARFAWSAEAISYTEVQASRADLRWALARAYGVGNSDMRIFLKHAHGAGPVAGELAKIVLALLVSPLAALLFLADVARRRRALRLLFRNAGKLAALLGRHHQEYAVIHGE